MHDQGCWKPLKRPFKLVSELLKSQAFLTRQNPTYQKSSFKRRGERRDPKAQSSTFGEAGRGDASPLGPIRGEICFERSDFLL